MIRRQTALTFVHLAFASLIGTLAFAMHDRALAASPAKAEAIFVDGTREPGELAGIDSQWNVTFRMGDKLRVVPAADIVYWGTFRDRESGPQLLLADGGQLHVDLLELTDDTLTIGDSTGLGRIPWDETTLPRSAVRAVVVQPPADVLERDRLFARIAAYDKAADQLLLTSGETIEGRVASAPLGGRFLPADQQPADVYTLTRPGLDEPLAVPAAKVLAVVFGVSRRVATPTNSRTGGQLGFRDGSLLNVAAIETKGDTVELSLIGGGKLLAPLDHPDELAPTFWNLVTWLAPYNSSAVYLSDVKPIGYKHIPLLTLDWPYRTDRNCLGGRLRSGGHLFGKGLGMHTVSRLAYALDGKYRRFESEIALDDSAGQSGSVVFKVLVERQPNDWTTAYESPVIRGGQPPLPISVDVSGGRRLVLIVDHADHLDVADNANWLMARLLK